VQPWRTRSWGSNDGGADTGGTVPTGGVAPDAGNTGRTNNLYPTGSTPGSGTAPSDGRKGRSTPTQTDPTPTGHTRKDSAGSHSNAACNTSG